MSKPNPTNPGRASPQHREWDSAAYERLSQPQQSWGKKVLERVQLSGDETVLDAGCGTGKLTAELLAALPKGRVVGIDLSRNMLSSARENLAADFGGRVSFAVADFCRLPFDAAFDGIFSTAAFHWVKDHDLLFASLFRALRPGGWLVAQCGGGPNLAQVRERFQRLATSPPYSRYLGELEEPWLFSDPETAAVRLHRTGFVEVDANLEEAPTPLGDADTYRDFLTKLVFRTHLERLPDAELRKKMMADLSDQAASDKPAFCLDYWRLNLRARRPLSS